MTEFIFKKSDYTNADPEKDRRGVHKKGDCINRKPDGWAANWPNVGDYANHFVCIRCPEITDEEAEAADHCKPWREDFDYEILSTTQSGIVLRVWNKNTSPSGAGGLTREKVDRYLTGWGCSDISFANRSVTFTFDLWDAVRSSEFWDVSALEIANFTFTLNSYNSTTRIGNITVSWQASKELPMRFIRNQIENRNGNIISFVEGENDGDTVSYTFEIERNDIVTRFRDDVKRKAEQIYKRHQYSISEADVDAIDAIGGIVTMARDEFFGKLINHLEI